MNINIRRNLDWQSGNSKLDEILFGVETKPLFVEIEQNNINGLFGSNQEKTRIVAKGYRAVINKSTQDILGVVSSNYHLISNADAIEKGKEAFKEIFNISLNDLIVNKVITSKNKTFCHVDLIHPNVNFNVWEQDCWYPFIRVTNSYNRTFALSYELGFVRKLCSNGVIFDKKTIKVKIAHNKKIDQISFKADVSKFNEAKSSFISKMLSLKKFHIPKKKHFPLICKCLEIKKPLPGADGKLNERIQDQYSNLIRVSSELSNQYVNSEGETAYSLFNVITDLVSHQSNYNNIPNYHLRPGSYSFKPTEWIEDFVTEIEKRTFDLEKYIGEYNDY
jgi:hypothetical protein